MRTPAAIVSRIVARELRRLPKGRDPETYHRNRSAFLWDLYQAHGLHALRELLF